MPRLRYQPPDRLLGAAEFSKHDELCGSLNIVRLLKDQPWIWDELRAACAIEKGAPRKREPGHWELAAIAFVSSRSVDIRPWWQESSAELWRECGFRAKPTYITAWRRLSELEEVSEAFLDAAGAVIRHCREQDARVMAHVHVDSTEDETNASFVHDCQAGERCAYERNAPGHAKRPDRVTTAVARKHREEVNEAPADEDDPAAPKDGDVEIVLRGTRPIKRVRRRGCWYRTRDVHAGIRQYDGPRKSTKFWHGYYSSKAIDHFTGGVIPLVDSASRVEHHLFPELYDLVKDMVGAPPDTVIGDKGFSIKSCFEHATSSGSTPVFPWRHPGGNSDGTRHDRLTHDRHGVKRCRHCGGPMEQVRFSAKGKPRLWFRCMIGAAPECTGEQTINCEQDWRALIPLPRTDPLYHELKASHKHYEGVHSYWRDRYRVGADSNAIRPKRVSIDWHRLRAHVACLIDWLRIAAANEWLTTGEAPLHEGVRKFKERGRAAARELAEARARIGLMRPYGPRAERLRIGWALPPSERPRGKLKDQLLLAIPGP
jgi:hypothetical protein